jgi:hypothetical protein
MVFTTCSLAEALDVTLQKCNQTNFKNQGYAKEKIIYFHRPINRQGFEDI